MARKITKLYRCNGCIRGPCFLCQTPFPDYCMTDEEVINWVKIIDDLELYINKNEHLKEELRKFNALPDPKDCEVVEE